VQLLVAVLALIVAVQYAIIAVVVVPALARLALHQGRPIQVARWGACAFFAGCAVTHTMIAISSVRELTGTAAHGMAGMAGMAGAGMAAPSLWEHVLPHVAQVVGGGLFIGVAYRRLSLTVMTKDEAGALRELELQLRTVFDQAPVGVALLAVGAGRTGSVLQVNPALCRLVGHDEQTLRSHDFGELLVHPGDRDAGLLAAQRLLTGPDPCVEVEQRYLHRDGHEFWAHVTSSLTRDEAGDPMHYVVQVRDVTDDRRRESHLRHLAEHDPLTGLFNRRRFRDELDRMLATVQRYQVPAALLVIDLDHFKDVNDSYGHGTGDQLLQKLATVLSSRLRATDVLGRLGGDEFGVLLPHTDEEGASTVAAALLQAVREEAHLPVQGCTVRAYASIGVTVLAAGDAGADGDELLERADVAMYAAKQTGRNRVAGVGAPAQPAAGPWARPWSARVREALEGAALWEQPVLNLSTGELDRSELLPRLVDPGAGSLVDLGRLQVPGRFDEPHTLDSWTCSSAIDLLETRQAAGDTRSLEVHLSAGALADEVLVEEVCRRLASAAFDPARLIVAVPAAAVGDLDHARSPAARLADLGCRIALDDIGSGGSFCCLKHLLVDGVRIDGKFVKDLPSSAVDLLALDAVLTLAHGLGKEVTAEHVRNDATLALLRERRVAYAQGTYVARPRPVPELAARPVRRDAARLPIPVPGRAALQGQPC
jgi:diguanylate cyclase (GGDEF)-like protein/PAS domain S-box-containing protein